MRHLAVVLLAALIPAAALAHSTFDRFWGEVPVDMQFSGDVLVTKELVVPAGVTLTIEPGTLVRFERSEGGVNRILVRGRLVASGTAENPIMFIPKDPTSGPWQGVVFEDGATGVMQHCVIEGSVKGIGSPGPGVTVRYVEVRR